MLCFLFISSCYHDHEDYPKHVENRRLNEDVNESTEEWYPIRIFMDYSKIENADELSCQSVGQSVTLSSGKIKCEEADIMTDPQRKALIETLNNVKEFVESSFKIRRWGINSHYIYSDHRDYSGITAKEVQDIDLYINVFSRSFVDRTPMASAIIGGSQGIDRRPYHGFLTVNVRKIPDVPSKYDSWKNAFFFTCLHEVFHILGFSRTAFREFHPIDDVKSLYREPTCSFVKQGKTFTFLITPFCHKYAQVHYGVDTFYGDDGAECPSGIELEDGGGSASAGTHLETRTFYTDIMMPYTPTTNSIRFLRFTDATMAVLLDTGNYQINYSVVQPLVWGNKDSIDGQTYIKDFATGSPQLTFPYGYLSKSSEPLDPCGFDYTFSGIPTDINPPNCASVLSIDDNTSNAETNDYYLSKDAIKLYCQGKQFYNPLNEKTIANDEFNDFINFKGPEFICPPGYATIPFMQECMKFDIQKDKIRFKNNNFDITCDYTSNWNKVSYQKSQKYRCPPYQRFVRTMGLFNSFFQTDPFDESPQYLIDANLNISTLDYTPQPTLPLLQKAFEPLTITLFAVGGVLLILVIIAAVVRFRRCKADDQASQHTVKEVDDIEEDSSSSFIPQSSSSTSAIEAEEA